MLGVLVSFSNSLLMGLLGFYIIKILTKSETQIYSLRTIIYLLLECIIVTVLQERLYPEIKPLIIYSVNIIIYKNIFKLNIDDSIIVVGIAMILNLIGDVIVSVLITIIALSNQTMINNNLAPFVNTLIVLMITLLIINNSKVKEKLCTFYTNIANKTKVSTVIFFLLTVIISCILGFHIYKSLHFDVSYIATLITIGILITLIIIFINSRNQYNSLVNEYDSLFSYIQNFEDWIEKEQLNRHEYKNQLAVLRCLTKEKKVKNKIDEILEDNINIEDQEVTQLKRLPKGGIKGLMYYKAALAQKNKINLTTDVSIDLNSTLTKLSEKEIKILCKLIGIYFDNAIEAAIESRKKKLSIEVYELKDKVSFIFSNTFRKNNIFKDRNRKGVSSKGKGRGNGLYFADKLIKENNWLEQKQEIIDRYYIQEIIINKKNIYLDILLSCLS